MWLQCIQYRRFHISYGIFACSVGILAGLLVGRIVLSSVLLLVLAISAAILVGGALRSMRWWSLIIICLAGLMLGISRSSYIYQELNTYKPLIGNNQIVSGAVASDPTIVSESKQRIELVNIELVDGKSYPGKVFLTVNDSINVKRGDRVVAEGILRGGFGSYQATLSVQQLDSVKRPKDIIRDVREKFGESVRSVVIEPMASLGLGFVVGQRSALPASLDEQLKIVGLTHIVVASGYNLTILVRFITRVMSKQSRFMILTTSLTVIGLFAAFSGFSPSMNRAVLVTVLGLLAWYVGRRFHPVHLLAFVAAITSLVNPTYIYSDLGWYLSFFAFAGVLIVAPLILRLLYKNREPSAPVQLVTETIGAELMALPLIAFSFGMLPVFGLIANVLVAPLVPFAMALITIAGIIAMASSTLAGIFGYAANILIGYMVAVIEQLSSIEYAALTINVGIAELVVWYMLITAFCSIAAHKTRYNFRSRSISSEL